MSRTREERSDPNEHELRPQSARHQLHEPDRRALEHQTIKAHGRIRGLDRAKVGNNDLEDLLDALTTAETMETHRNTNAAFGFKAKSDLIITVVNGVVIIQMMINPMARLCLSCLRGP